MKYKKILSLLIFSIYYINCNAQIPKGKVQLIEFTNANAKFTIPDGKSWVIYSVFSDYVTDCTLKTPEYSTTPQLDAKDIRIFLKELNGVEKTNIEKNVYGTQLYRSTNASTAIYYPVIFPAKTNFSLSILKGDMGSLKLYDGVGYISFIEIDN